MLIITDGEGEDIEEAKDLIVELSEMPCSIIMVGVGPESFEQLEVLDADD